MNINDKVTIINPSSYFFNWRGVLVEKDEYYRVVFDNPKDLYGFWFKPEYLALVIEPKAEDFKSINDLVIELLKKQDYSMKELAEVLSINTRQVRDIIEDLVIKGYPINNLGKYGWIHTQAELEKCYELQRKRALSSLARLRALKKMRIDEPLLEEEK